MNFERHNIDPLRTLSVGRRALKKQQMQDLLYKEKFTEHVEIWMGMGLIIDLIKEKKDGEYLEIFKEELLKYFLIPARKGEKWRWEALYEVIPQFPNKGVFRAHQLIIEIVASFANLP